MAQMRQPAIFGTHDDNTLAQLADVSLRAEQVALMADGHLGYVMPIGGVAAYRNQVSVVGVGFDIACGNCAIQTDLTLDSFDLSQLETIADEVQSTLSFGVGRTNKASDAPVEHPLFEDSAWYALPEHIREPLKDKARSQLGTVGSGNHYVDVLADQTGRLWVGVHFGSRGLGHTIASGFLALGSGEQWGAKVKETEVLLGLNSPLGESYFRLMELAGEYAYAGREWVARKVVDLLGGSEQFMVHNHHNFAWREEHNGEDYIVVRKGATPAFPGQLGFVGGSMGDDSVILRGSVSNSLDIQLEQEKALYSTVHGAGRVMSRTEAAGKTKRRKVWVCSLCGESKPVTEDARCAQCDVLMNRQEVCELLRPGKITPEMMQEWVDNKGVILRGGGLDESPHVYRRLSNVLAAQGGTVEVMEVLSPLVVVMAGANEFDPYKD